MTTYKIASLEHVTDGLYMQAIEKVALKPKRKQACAWRENVTNKNIERVTM
jgi:hypothetical protein